MDRGTRLGHFGREHLESQEATLGFPAFAKPGLQVVAAWISFVSHFVTVHERDDPEVGNVGPDGPGGRDGLADHFGRQDVAAFTSEGTADPRASPLVFCEFGKRPGRHPEGLFVKAQENTTPPGGTKLAAPMDWRL